MYVEVHGYVDPATIEEVYSTVGASEEEITLMARTTGGSTVRYLTVPRQEFLTARADVTYLYQTAYPQARTRSEAALIALGYGWLLGIKAGDMFAKLKDYDGQV